jgi:ParB/RepB/Spo0J family partition protein
MGKSMSLPIAVIEENDEALRTQVAKEQVKYQELKKGIQTIGLLSPISVREYTKEDGSTGYRLLDGLHRKTAMTDLGYTEIPVHVVDISDSDLLAAQIIAQQNVATTKTQYAQALKQLIQHKGLTIKEVASMVARQDKWVSDQLGLLDLPPSVHTLIDEGKLSVANALSLRRVRDRLEDFLPLAMTESSEAFALRVNDAIKEFRAAALQGRKPGAPEFKPVGRIRKLADMRSALEEIETTNHCSELKALMETQGLHFKTAEAKALLAWVFQLDPVSIATQKAVWDSAQNEKKEKAEVRAAEIKTKKENALKKTLAELTAS